MINDFLSNWCRYIDIKTLDNNKTYTEHLDTRYTVKFELCKYRENHMPYYEVWLLWNMTWSPVLV